MQATWHSWLFIFGAKEKKMAELVILLKQEENLHNIAVLAFFPNVTPHHQLGLEGECSEMFSLDIHYVFNNLSLFITL